VDKDKRIKGAFTLRELVIAKPSAKVTDFMEDRVVSVELKDSQQVVAQVIAKYNLLAVPVVDDQIVSMALSRLMTHWIRSFLQPGRNAFHGINPGVKRRDGECSN